MDVLGYIVLASTLAALGYLSWVAYRIFRKEP